MNCYTVDTSYAAVFLEAKKNCPFKESFFKGRSIALLSGIALIGIKALETLTDVISLALRVAKCSYYLLLTLGTFGCFRNGERLVKNAGLAILKSLIIVSIPVQVALASLSTLASLIHPKLGYGGLYLTMLPSKHLKSLYTKLENSYPHSFITQKLSSCWNWSTGPSEFFNPCEIFKMFTITELSSLCKAALLFPLKSFTHVHNLNPETPRFPNKPPILMIHGMMHNHTGFFPLAAALENADRDVYTINLNLSPGYVVFNRDPRDRLKEKVEQIVEGRNTREIDIIAHSAGTVETDYIHNELSGGENPIRIHRFIALGGRSINDDPLFNLSVHADKDCLAHPKYQHSPDREYTPQNYEREVSGGHVSLFFSPQIEPIVREFLLEGC